MEITFTITGTPVGKSRPRFTKGGRAYTPNKTRHYEEQVADVAAKAMVGVKYNDAPVRAFIIAYMDIPKSYSDARRKRCMANEHFPTRPDVDNLLKAILDGCNGIVYKDDRFVWDVRCIRRYDDGKGPRVEATFIWDSGS
jgi:Holliday junction resolvase RusA-like endonuclease